MAKKSDLGPRFRFSATQRDRPIGPDQATSFDGHGLDRHIVGRLNQRLETALQNWTIADG